MSFFYESFHRVILIRPFDLVIITSVILTKQCRGSYKINLRNTVKSKDKRKY